VLAARGASVSHNPTSNLRLRNGIARVPLMLEKGLNVGIGLDGMSFIQPDLFAEMRLALTLGRPPGVETPGLDARTVFKLATQGGTRAALGRDDLGVLEAGRPADLVVLDASRLTPFSAVERDPVELVVGRGRPELVETVMVGGEVLVRDGRHVRQDLAAVERELNDALAEMAGQQPEPWRADLNERMRAFYAAWPIETRGWEAAPPSYA
jgi:cytosine/adenosine deaminase-related metal-dependent hydrolase